jgi:hypothetical protein
MELLSSIITALVTSAAVSSFAALILNTWLEARIKHWIEKDMERIKHNYELELEKARYLYQIEIEKIKTSLAANTSTFQEVLERRLIVYPKIVEIVYRARNIARELAKTPISSQVLFNELKARSQELEETLYASRMDLERDQIFLSIHSYKNIVKTFIQLAEDFYYFDSQQSKEGKEDLSQALIKNYTELEKQYEVIITMVSNDKSLKYDPSG